MSFPFSTPYETAKEVAERAKQCRLHYNLSQKTLSQRSGVSLGTLKKFETSGKISFESLLKIAVALKCLNDFQQIFKPQSIESYRSLDDLINEKERKRGRE